MKRLLVIVVLCLCAAPLRASLASVYITQAASGGDTGLSCAAAHAVTFFNAVGNWGAGAAQIGADTVVHFCGTFTGTAASTMATCQAQVGTSGHSLILESDPGTAATFTAPYWSTTNGAIYCPYDYITIDGSSNGTVTASANGTSLANAIESVRGIVAGDPNVGNAGVIVKNWTIANLYVHDPALNANDIVGRQVRSIVISCLGNTTCSASGNTIHDTGTGILAQEFGSSGTMNINGNTIFNACQAILPPPQTPSATWAKLWIYGNELYTTHNWENTSDTLHCEEIQLFTNANDNTIVVTDTEVFNNYIHGYNGPNNSTTMLYFANKAFTNGLIFNNLFVLEQGHDTDGTLFVATNAGLGLDVSMYNNTFIDLTGNSAEEALEVGFSGATGSLHDFRNNVIQGFNHAIQYFSTTAITGTVNNNYYWNTAQGSGFFRYNATLGTFAQWQTACSCDAASSSQVAAPGFTATYTLLPSSPLILFGPNLTSLGNTNLNSDKASIARPAVINWDAGAYQFSGSALSPSVPIGRLP